ncbi:ACP phosphodiesterase [Agarivorans sp. TSD2052]|uniref:acyl carrier protein phosphodiesterase n=1 Tax=Agarivorans sp. TSD2052 TaxID=2937286 RepID=UPI00201078B8|nr:ACP phosphodiesterase [Agarivorans sp. TSD2052]UPW19988.1 ACP phosphodiesterase [Agarivorans sp. TSD2052]
MNYLAHFHIAQHTSTSISGALLGDFVKGNQWQDYPPVTQLGILLHRQVDSFTDQHIAAEKISLCFQPALRRYSGIALDVYFDHLLTQQWENYASLPLNTFIKHCYQQLKTSPLNDRALVTANHMREYNWLKQYQTRDNIKLTLQAISKRLRRPVRLDLLMDDIDKHEAVIEAVFIRLYPQVLYRAEQFVKQQSL